MQDMLGGRKQGRKCFRINKDPPPPDKARDSITLPPIPPHLSGCLLKVRQRGAEVPRSGPVVSLQGLAPGQDLLGAAALSAVHDGLVSLGGFVTWWAAWPMGEFRLEG